MLTSQQVLEILRDKGSKLDGLKKEHKELLMHVHGVGVVEHLTKIEGLENDTKIALRKKLSRSNKDLFADILRQTDKIFNSQGGSKVYLFKNKKRSIEFTERINNLNNEEGLTQWLKTYFVDKLVVDPNGLFMIEHKDGIPYPVYKSILTIKYYEQKGRWVENIVFEPVEIDNKKYVRVYDEAFDYTYLYEKDSLTLIDEQTYPNVWGYVPAITCSDITDTLTDFKKSTIYEQIELANEYLRENSVKTISSYHHKYPVFWMYQSSCPVCAGMGFVNKTDISGEITQHTCYACGGSRLSTKKDVSDVKLITPPQSNDDPQITPDIAGYVVPPIDALKFMNEDLKTLRDMIYFSHWGTIINRDDNEKTAFEVASNIQPMQDRLNQYTNSLEDTEKKLTDMLGDYLYQDYEGCSINYGRNYIIKSPNQYLTEYLEEKSKGASYTTLNSKLSMYYNALFANDEYSRIINLKLIEVEPWVHNTTKEVKEWQLPINEFNRKVYYNDWVTSKTKDELFAKSVIDLQKDLISFTNDKTKENDTEEVQRVSGGRGLDGQEKPETKEQSSD